MPKKILAFKGSPRKNSNSDILLRHFATEAEKNGAEIEIVDSNTANIDYCSGCLRCNLIHRCSNHRDDWTGLSTKILQADIIVFASSVYFHHLTAPLKKILDRFRSFHHVQITESGLVHTPYHTWEKDFVLLLSMGSPSNEEAKPIVKLFEFVTELMGEKNKLHVVEATRVGIGKQVSRSKDELLKLYEKMKIPTSLAEPDYKNNQETLKKCENLAKKLT